MIHLVGLSDGADSSQHIVPAVPIEPCVTALWFMWSERKFLLVCCIIKASAEWLVTKNQGCRCHPPTRRDFCGKQLWQWRISLGIFCFAIFKGSIFLLAPPEDSSFPLPRVLAFKAPGRVRPCSQGLGPRGLAGGSGERCFVEPGQAGAHVCHGEDRWLDRMLLLCNGWFEFPRRGLQAGEAVCSV